jgi:hypothetical protein
MVFSAWSFGRVDQSRSFFLGDGRLALAPIG